MSTSPSRRAQPARTAIPAAALAQLQEQVRAKPADAKLRVFLFQLLCVLGQWERALNQLKVAAELDAGALAMAQMYGEAVRCEAMRSEVFAGTKSPMVFGEPEQWLALLIESLLVGGQRRRRASRGAARCARSRRPTRRRATINGQPFEWIADADSRLGPVLEAVINGRYYWVPFARLAAVTIEAPEDLRDVVWMPAHLQFENGGEAVALIPTRYPGSEAIRRRADRAGAQDGLGGSGARHASRPRPAHARHRRGGRAAAGAARRWSCAPARSPRPARAPDMAEQLTPQERLQPALLDRLTDDEPDKKQEPREQRVLSKAACGRPCCAISPGCSTPPGSSRGDLDGAVPYARRSVINFGLPALSGPDRVDARRSPDLERAIRQAILDFEPRILPETLRGQGARRARARSITTTSSASRSTASCGRSRCRSSCCMRTEIDLETGKVQIADLAPSRVG